MAETFSSVGGEGRPLLSMSSAWKTFHAETRNSFHLHKRSTNHDILFMISFGLCVTSIIEDSSFTTLRYIFIYEKNIYDLCTNLSVALCFMLTVLNP